MFFWQIIMRCWKHTFSSSFLTVLRLALKSTDSLTLEPRRAPNMASAEIFTLLRAGLFILPLNSVIFMFKSVIWTDWWKSTQIQNCMYFWWFFRLWMIDIVPLFHSWPPWRRYRTSPHLQHQSSDGGLCREPEKPPKKLSCLHIIFVRQSKVGSVHLHIPEVLERTDRRVAGVGLAHARWSLSLSVSPLFQL